MKLPASYRKMRLRKGKERGFTNRHPWIFSGAFESSDREGVAGETVEIYDHNGKYLATGHFNPGTIMVRLFSYKRVIADTLFWEGKIRSAIKLRETLGLLDDSTDSLRVVHAEGDHLPGLIVDKYGEHLVMQCFSPGMNNESDSIAEAMDKCFKPETIYLKRSTAAAESKWIKGDQSETIILENGIRFRVN